MSPFTAAAPDPLPEVRGTGRRCVVLLSGGLDSATCLAWARAHAFECVTIAFRYGQRHAIELEAAARVSSALGAASHREVAVDLRAIGGSALTAEIDVPKGRSAAAMSEGVPVTYVPARNTVFLALALALAETIEAADLVAGMNAIDYSGYPDCRPEFVGAFETLATLATRSGSEGTRFHVHAPLMRLDKAQIIRLGTVLGVPFALTHSCYDPAPDGRACGACDSCELRRRGFAAAGVADPTRYAGTSGV
jgi:7-cyano-7-deazaguanine synthase